MSAIAAEAIPTRPVLRYHGGKWRVAPWIISHFPAHRVYAEPSCEWREGPDFECNEAKCREWLVADAALAAAQEDSAEELSPEEQSTWAYIQKLVDDNPEAFTEHRQRAIAEVLAHGLQACRDLHEARKVSAEALRQVYGADAAQESDK